MDEPASVAVGLDNLFERDGGVDLGRVLVRPVGFEGRVVPVVERLLRSATAPRKNHLACRDAVALMDVSSGSGSCM